MEDVEYRPQRRAGINALVKACVATVVALALILVGIRSPGARYLAIFPAVAAIAWFASYGARRQLRCRLTATGIESRRLRTRFIPWTQIRDIKVVERVIVARLPVPGNRVSGRYGSGSGGGARKVAAIRVLQANGRWRELAMPVVWENAHDAEFDDKSDVIKDRWRAMTGQAPADALDRPGER